MKIKIIFLSCLTMIGCSVIKVPTITGVNKENRIVRLGYEYGSFQRPQPKWEKAYASATEQCRSWGYKDAQESSNAQTECKDRNRRGDCTQFFTYADYQCNLTDEMVFHKREQERLAYEQSQVAEAAKRLRNDQFNVVQRKYCTNKVRFYNDITEGIANKLGVSPNGISVSRVEWVTEATQKTFMSKDNCWVTFYTPRGVAFCEVFNDINGIVYRADCSSPIGQLCSGKCGGQYHGL